MQAIKQFFEYAYWDIKTYQILLDTPRYTTVVTLVYTLHKLNWQGPGIVSLQASLEFRGFDIRGFEFSRFIISTKLVISLSPHLDLA